MNSLFAPDILPKSIKLTHFGGCLEPNKYSGSPVSGSSGGSGSLFGKSGSSPYEINSNNNVPVIRNPIDRLNVTAGELLRFKVPQGRDIQLTFKTTWFPRRHKTVKVTC